MESPPPCPGGLTGFPEAAPGTGSLGGLDLGGEEGRFVISAKLSGRAHCEMSSREPFLESTHPCHCLQKLCMPASVLLKGPASSDSPRSLVTRKASCARERAVTAEAGARQEALVWLQIPWTPIHAASNSQVKLGSTWDCMPALSLKSC